MALTPYPFAVGKDPTWDAWRAGSDFRRKNAQDDAALKNSQAEDTYKQALASLDQQGIVGERNINTGMLQRGVYRSGETNRRQADLQAALLSGRSQADTNRANALGQVSSDLQRALASLDLEWEQQTQAALARQRAGGSGGGGGGRGGSGTTTSTVPFQTMYAGADPTMWDMAVPAAPAAPTYTPRVQPKAGGPIPWYADPRQTGQRIGGSVAVPWYANPAKNGQTPRKASTVKTGRLS